MPIHNDDIAGIFEQIADLLKEEGLDIARRTVTKYRKALRIPSSRQRREWD